MCVCSNVKIAHTPKGMEPLPSQRGGVDGAGGEGEGPRNLTSMHVCTRSHLDLTLEDRRTCMRAPAHRARPTGQGHRGAGGATGPPAPHTPAVSAHRHQPATSQPPPHLRCISQAISSLPSLSQIGISLSPTDNRATKSALSPACSLSVARVALSPSARPGSPVLKWSGALSIRRDCSYCSILKSF